MFAIALAPSLFHLTDQTAISDRTGLVTTGRIKVGEGATIVMRPGKNGARMALTIRLDHNTSFPSGGDARGANSAPESGEGGDFDPNGVFYGLEGGGSDNLHLRFLVTIDLTTGLGVRVAPILI